MEPTRFPFLVRTRRHVWLGVAAITVTCMATASGAVLVLVLGVFRAPLSVALLWTLPALLLPAMIAPPVAWFGLSVARMLTSTIDRVDEFVRHDTLTGVLTRAYLLGKVREVLPRGGTFLMVDADHFKAINDTYGHDVGDEALKRIAEALRRAAPGDALVGRLGGEEFGVFLPGLREQEAATAAEALIRTMRELGRSVAGHELNMTISVGGAEHLPDRSFEATMKLADQALYHAKRTGRDRFYIAAATDTMPALILRSRLGST